MRFSLINHSERYSIRSYPPTKASLYCIIKMEKVLHLNTGYIIKIAIIYCFGNWIKVRSNCI